MQIWWPNQVATVQRIYLNQLNRKFDSITNKCVIDTAFIKTEKNKEWFIIRYKSSIQETRIWNNWKGNNNLIECWKIHHCMIEELKILKAAHIHTSWKHSNIFIIQKCKAQKRLEKQNREIEKFQLTIGARRPPKTIIPDTSENDVMYSCFKVFGVWFRINQKKIRMQNLKQTNTMMFLQKEKNSQIITIWERNGIVDGMSGISFSSLLSLAQSTLFMRCWTRNLLT